MYFLRVTFDGVQYCQVPGMTFFLSITVDDVFFLSGTGHDVLKPDTHT